MNFHLFRWKATVVVWILMEVDSGGGFCGVIVVTENCGNIKGQFPCVDGTMGFSLNWTILYISLVLKSLLGHLKPPPKK